MRYFAPVGQDTRPGFLIKCWCDNPEDGAIEQAKNLAGLPFAFHHICLMPDTHQGYGMPIGGVLATRNAIIPNAVGVDIGCGMCAVKTPWNVADVPIEQIKKIMGKIRETVPVGFAHHTQPQKMLDELENIHPFCEIVRREYKKAQYQIGTLGGGNHFIEIQRDEEGTIWIMLHSGSRNLGKQVADYYNKLAIQENKKWHCGVPAHWQLAFFPTDSDSGRSYIAEMNYCVEFALQNRKLMMTRIAKAFESVIGWKKICFEDSFINIAHNYARLENHFGQNVWVHRKGATSARLGEVGIIPGSQGTSSYIVEGKGNSDSFTSCSHGAGRKLGRKQAQRELDLEAEKKKLDDLGIIHAVRTEKDLDEAAGAYKDIDIVMQEQKDLVQINVKLSPIAVIKG